MENTPVQAKVELKKELTHEVYRLSGFPQTRKADIYAVFTDERRRQGFWLHDLHPLDASTDLLHFRIQAPVGRIDEVWKDIEALLK